MSRCYDYVVSERSRTIANALDDIVSEIDHGKPAFMLADRIAHVAELAKK